MVKSVVKLSDLPAREIYELLSSEVKFYIGQGKEVSILSVYKSFKGDGKIFIDLGHEEDEEVVDETTIPWDALAPYIKYVAMDISGQWRGYSSEPEAVELGGWSMRLGGGFNLTHVNFPLVDPSLWEKTLVKRPE